MIELRGVMETLPGRRTRDVDDGLLLWKARESHMN